MTETPERRIEDLLYVGLNSRVIALDRYEGNVVWKWKASQGSGFVSLLLDGDRLMAAVNGYVTCLDPLYGQEVWVNPLKGFGTGITSLATINGSTGASPPAQIAMQRRQQQAATTTATT